MLKKITVIILSVFLLANVCGCAVLLVGAGAAGTAVWLSGKLTQEFNASYERTVIASEKALKSLKMPILKEAKEENVTQLKSSYSDGSETWIDVRKITDNSSKVEVRVGGVTPDKAAAEKILDRIKRYL